MASTRRNRLPAGARHMRPSGPELLGVCGPESVLARGLESQLTFGGSSGDRCDAEPARLMSATASGTLSVSSWVAAQLAKSLSPS